MERYLLAYIVVGLLSSAFCIWICHRYKASPLIGEVLFSLFVDPTAFIISSALFLLWPILCVNDLLSISSQRKNRYAFLKRELSRRREVRKLKQKERAAYRAIIGMNGVTVTPLCLSGKVEIAGKIWDAHSIDGYVASDVDIIVKNRVGNELKVEVVKN